MSKLTKKRKFYALEKLLALAVLVLLYIFFSIFGENFFSSGALVNILDSCYYIGFMAIGTTFVIITGGIDLSIGTNLICSAMFGGAAYNLWGWSIEASLILAVIVGTLIGVLNGYLIAHIKLPPFIATLGTQMMTMGLGAIITKVMTMRYPTVGSEDAWFKSVFYKYNGFPTGILWLIGFFILGLILLNKTRFGRYTFAIGSGREVARLSGINVKRYELLIYTLCGFFAGLGAIFYAAAYTSIIPSTGNGFELLAIAGVVIGGTSMSGGTGSLSGTMIGVLVMAVLKQGLMSMGLQGQWQNLFTGIVVILAVMLDIQRTTKQKKAG